MIDNEVTIVTAFQDIGRDKWEGFIPGRGHVAPYIKRDVDTYFERFSYLTQLKNPIVVYIEGKFKDKIEEITRHKSNATILPIEPILDETQWLLDKIRTVQYNPEFMKFIENPTSPEYWSPEYVLINFLKSWFVFNAYMEDCINTGNAAWIDFGYARKPDDAPSGKTFVFNTHDRVNLFSNGDVSGYYKKVMPIFEIVRTGKVIVQGCHIIAPTCKWAHFDELMDMSFESLINSTLIDDDQTMLLMSYRQSPERFILNKNSNNDWFNVIRNNCI